jgi:succinate dehydrogenase/fumarate reductase cytochrome b subunit
VVANLFSNTNALDPFSHEIPIVTFSRKYACLPVPLPSYCLKFTSVGNLTLFPLGIFRRPTGCGLVGFLLFTLILTAWEFKKPFCKNENKSWMAKAKYFFKIKNASQKFLTNFFVSEIFIKYVIFSAFDDNLGVTHVFIKQIFRAVEVAPPFPLPHHHRAVQCA